MYLVYLRPNNVLKLMECLDKDRAELRKETRHIFSNQVRVLSFPEHPPPSQAIQAILLRQNMSFHSAPPRKEMCQVVMIKGV